MRVKAVEDYSDTESARIGETDTADCVACTADDDAYLWANDHWRLKTLAPASPLPVSLILETRQHLDLYELDADRAADLGRITVELTRLVEDFPEVGRLHTYRWGDGARHCHLWFLGRPYGAEQLRGVSLPLWALTLPPADIGVTDPINNRIAAHMAELPL